jgi:ribA/ribD-fused uncharacterized protein
MQKIKYIKWQNPTGNLRETVSGHFENDEYVFFWNGPFSNWHPAEFEMNTATKYGLMKFTSSEQAMMFYKGIVFDDDDSIKLIMATDSPREQKALGRKIPNFDQAKWESVCIDLISGVLVAKFNSDPELKKILLDTQEKTIVEASPYDAVWGIGMGVDNPDILDETKWRGKNFLGICLMNARELLKS